MNFELTEQQTLIRDMARSFAEAELAPRAVEGVVDLGEVGLRNDVE